MDVEEALIGPVAGGYEEDQEQGRAVDTWPVVEIGEEEERHDESNQVSVSFLSLWKTPKTHSGDALVGIKRSGSQLQTIR